MGIDDDVVGGDVAMQQALAMHVVQRGQKPRQQARHELGLVLPIRIGRKVQKLAAPDQVKRDIGGVVLFEHLVDADDVGMAQPGQVPRLSHEHLDKRTQVGSIARSSRFDGNSVARRQDTRKTFLEHDFPFQAVGGQVGDAEAAHAEKPLDRELTTQQRDTGSECFRRLLGLHEWVVILGHQRDGI